MKNNSVNQHGRKRFLLHSKNIIASYIEKNIYIIFFLLFLFHVEKKTVISLEQCWKYSEHVRS